MVNEIMPLLPLKHINRPLIIFASLLISATSFAQINNNIVVPRTGLTGIRLTYNSSKEAIAIAILPNSHIIESDEIDPKIKTISVYVWRTRNYEEPCILKVLNVQVQQELQLFTLPANSAKPFDGIMFEGRPWYEVRTSLYEIGKGQTPSDPLKDPFISGNVVYCTHD